jgi:hypothetical protein
MRDFFSIIGFFATGYAILWAVGSIFEIIPEWVGNAAFMLLFVVTPIAGFIALAKWARRG